MLPVIWLPNLFNLTVLRYRVSGGFHSLTVVCLVIVAVVSLSDLHVLAGVLLVAAVMMIMFVCPFILLILQRSKVRASHGPQKFTCKLNTENNEFFSDTIAMIQAVMQGPWDEARPSDSKGPRECAHAVEVFMS
jgi:hypothetical protein